MNNMIRAVIGFAFASPLSPLLAAGVNPVISDANSNTAMGTAVLVVAFNNPSSGSLNVAAGVTALINDTGSANSGLGFGSLLRNTSGSYNSALGNLCLWNGTTGSLNTAIGAYAQENNSTGSENVAIGTMTLDSNLTGSYNTAIGASSGTSLSGANGSYNISIGAAAGSGTGSGSFNIEIGATGGSTDSNVIRIGTAGQQNAAYMQGVYGVEVGSNYAVVFIDNIGHLGTYGSSGRFKMDVKSMVPDEKKIARLRPVTFHLKNDLAGPLHRGLIAEEVDKIDPNLVIRNERGRIDGIHYEELTPILLKEIQEQRSELAAQSSELSNLERQITQLRKTFEEPQRRQAMLAKR